MDAQTRHGLKKNELAEMLSNLRGLMGERGRYITLAIAAVLVLVVGYRLWSWSNTSAREAAWQELFRTNVPDDADGSAQLDALRRIVAEASEPGLRSAAELRLGCGLLSQASFDTAKQATLVDEAISVLMPLGESSQTPVGLAAAAKYALGGAYEFKRDFAQAKRTYQAIADNEKFSGSPFHELAAVRAKNVDDLNVVVEFTPGDPPPASQPATQSTQPGASQPASADARSTTRPGRKRPASGPGGRIGFGEDGRIYGADNPASQPAQPAGGSEPTQP